MPLRRARWWELSTWVPLPHIETEQEVQHMGDKSPKNKEKRKPKKTAKTAAK
jgi:hypothetical protein